MAATPWARRSYAGGAPATKLASGISATDLTITVVDTTGWPATGPFFIVIDRGEATEEKIEVASRSGTTLSVSSTAQRGVDGTSASAHAAGRVVEHVITAVDVDEANAASHYTVGQVTAKGDMLAGSEARKLARVPVGSNGQVLVADSTETGGVKWGQVDTVGIADGAVTGEKLADGLAWAPGDLKMSAASTPPDGWLLCDGSNVSRSTYAALFAAIGTTFGEGNGSTTFTLPDFRGRVPYGASDSVSVGTKRGSATHTLTTGQLPPHTHNRGSLSTSLAGAHSHTIGTFEAGSSGLSGVAAMPNRRDFGIQHEETSWDSHHTHSITGNTGSTGSGQSFSLEQPSLAVNVFIKT